MRLPVVLIALVGCTPLFGLDGVANDDPDGDRVPTAHDNCPTIFNPDQSDVDGNGIGDACQICMATDPTDSDGDGIPDQCDGCDNRLPDNNHDGVPDACETMVSAHDEDGDGIPDIRDNCPSVANADQADNNESSAVADGVGSACDDSPARDVQLFDGFDQPNQLWTFDGSGWQLAGDQTTIAPISLVHRYAGVAHGTFRITTHATVPSGEQAMVVAVDGAQVGKQTKVECGLLRTTTVSDVVLAITASGVAQPLMVTPYTGSGTDQITLSAITPGPGSIQVTCTVGNEGPRGVQVLTPIPSFSAGLGAVTAGGLPTSNNMPIAFDYFDLVTSAP